MKCRCGGKTVLDHVYTHLGHETELKCLICGRRYPASAEPDKQSQPITPKQEVEEMQKRGTCTKCNKEDVQLVGKGLCWKCRNEAIKAGVYEVRSKAKPAASLPPPAAAVPEVEPAAATPVPETPQQESAPGEEADKPVQEQSFNEDDLQEFQHRLEPEPEQQDPVQVLNLAVGFRLMALFQPEKDPGKVVRVPFEERDRELLQRLEQSATFNRRSMAAEILFRLDRTFENE